MNDKKDGESKEEIDVSSDDDASSSEEGKDKKEKLDKKEDKKINSTEGEEVCETFEVTDNKGKEKIVKTCGTMPKKHADKEELKNQTRQLKILLIVIGGIVLFLVGGYLVMKSMQTYEYGGRSYDTVIEGNLILAHTSFPLYSSMTGNHIADYNVFIRNDPRKLNREVEFEGEIVLTDLTVLNVTGDFNCDGDGVISIANMNQMLDIIGSKVVQDPNTTCEKGGRRYTYIEIKEGEENKVIQTDESCYDFIVKDCEILKVTEKFMVEILELVQDEKLYISDEKITQSPSSAFN